VDSIYVVSPTVALVVSVLLQVLKTSKAVTWVTNETGKLNAVLSMAIAFLSSVGIVFSFDFDSETGRFAGQFSGTLSELVHALGHSVIQWSEQHLIYKGFIAPAEMLGEIRTLLERHK
jgi:hypothetical protein